MTREMAIGVLVAGLCLPHGTTAQGRDPLVDARRLYEAAAYADALAALASAEGIEALQYRALCELALGRTVDAERTIRQIVSQAPAFVPDGSVVPPRFVTLFAEARSAVLSGVVKALFADARRRFEAGDYEGAASQFGLIVALGAEPSVPLTLTLDDVKLIARGFVDLAQARLATTSEDPVPAVALHAEDVAPGDELESPLGAGATFVPAAVVRQDFPVWTADMGPNRDGRGVVRVDIGPGGRVTRAVIESSLDPRYDREVLAATARWRYRPATLNGDPVASQKVIAFELGLQ